jgi:hypothetical protein
MGPCETLALSGSCEGALGELRQYERDGAEGKEEEEVGEVEKRRGV